MEIKTMADVPTGAILECFNGRKYLYAGQTKILSEFTNANEIFLGIGNNGYQTFKYDFSVASGDELFAIKRIYLADVKSGLLNILNAKCERRVIWENSTKEMTIAEIEKALGHRIKIVKEKENNYGK